MTDRPSLAENLEQLEMEGKEPTVVVSVRLDAGTAKRLSMVAKRQRRRMSEVLRDAAQAYADAPETASGVIYSISSAGVDLMLGRPTATKATGRREDEEVMPVWDEKAATV